MSMQAPGAEIATFKTLFRTKFVRRIAKSNSAKLKNRQCTANVTPRFRKKVSDFIERRSSDI